MADEPLKPIEDDEEPISLDSDDEAPLSLVETEELAAAEMRAFGAGARSLHQQSQYQFRRQLNLDGSGATRCRIFHCKVAPASLEHMQEAINEWIDSDEIEVKHVSQVVGTMEGKTPEPNVILTIWY